MEGDKKPERYIKNPLLVLRGLAEIAMKGIRAVDDNIAEFNDINYPPFGKAEAPAATEGELMNIYNS